MSLAPEVHRALEPVRSLQSGITWWHECLSVIDGQLIECAEHRQHALEERMLETATKTLAEVRKRLEEAERNMARIVDARRAREVQP